MMRIRVRKKESSVKLISFLKDSSHHPLSKLDINAVSSGLSPPYNPSVWCESVVIRDARDRM